MSRGRGHTKEKPYTTKVAEEHGQPVIRLPKIFWKMGVKLNQHIVLEDSGDPLDLLNWELKVKPAKETSN